MKISKSIKYLAFSIVMLIITGCATQPQPLYAYGDYSDSYYSYKKHATPESLLELQKSMESAIENSSNSRSGRVPPGMYANLGYLYLKAGKPNDAISNFTKEKTIYPESALFMNRVINKIQVTEGNVK
ncbi:MAG: DUF4810 domain-containing protein [Sulfuricurvum sp.]|jgi:hypothetical protein